MLLRFINIQCTCNIHIYACTSQQWFCFVDHLINIHIYKMYDNLNTIFTAFTTPTPAAAASASIIPIIAAVVAVLFIIGLLILGCCLYKKYKKKKDESKVQSSDDEKKMSEKEKNGRLKEGTRGIFMLT